MNFTFHQLKVFTVVADKKSVTKAAEELHMTQPAVSIQLKKLQEQFNMPLTEIIGRRIHITDFGKELYDIAEKILNEVNSITYRTESFSGLLSGKLRLAVVSTGKYVMPYYLKQFLKTYPSVDLSMDVANRSRIVERLYNNEVDFALVSVLPKGPAVEQEILMTNKLFLIASSEEKITGGPTITKSIFEDLPLIFREEGSGTRQKMQQYFEKTHIHPKVKLELTSTEAVKQAVIAGLGFSILSLASIRSELLENDVKIIPVKGLPLKSEWRLVWLKQKKFSVVAKTYLDFIRKNKASIYHEYFRWIEKY
jgi:DNA-binding transcriptional LysR family regulator